MADYNNGDWVHAETTADQTRIEAVLDTLGVEGAHLLHVGVGNSKLAQRLANRAGRIDGLTVSPQELDHANSLKLPNYSVRLCNKYSLDLSTIVSAGCDFIIDNNLASFACCRHHFHVMLASYVGVLKVGGRILTDQAGMDWYHGQLGWPMTLADLASLENRFPLHVSKMTATVYALRRTHRRIGRARSFFARLGFAHDAHDNAR